MRLTRDVIFQVRCETPFGAEVRVVGSSESLGRWDPTRGFRLDTGAKLYPTWRSRSTILLDEGVEFKYAVAIPGQEARWEARENRRLPAPRESDCQVVLIQHVFEASDFERAVQLRPFPDRRAFSHLRRGRLAHLPMGLGRTSGSGCWHEEPAGSKSVLEDLGIDLPHSADSSSGTCCMTRASSTDSVSFLESEEHLAKHRTLLVWPQSVAPNGGVRSIDVFGSFTRPAWTEPLTLHLCPETGLWWIAVEEALPDLHPGTYEFKFLVNDHVWMTNPALPSSRSAEGVENNKLRIDYRLLTRIERKTSAIGLPPAPLGVRAVTFAEVGTQQSGGPPEETARSSGPRRAMSTAERLCRAGSVQSGLVGCHGQRTYSLPHLNGNLQSPRDMACFYDLAGGPEGGALYDSDVALLLELPDVKRQCGLSLAASAFYKPKDGTGDGEDGNFVEPPALGVADGVGGLQHVLGYTSKGFADELMSRCQSVAHGLANDSSTCVEPSENAERILCEGFAGVKKYGASTAAIAFLDTRRNRLGIAVLGDSGVMVIRRPTIKRLEDADNRVRSTRSFIVFKSPPQQHDFNYPYQLCRLPQDLKRLLLRRPDVPADCATRDVDVEEGDLVLLYSDGVDDNLHDQEVLEVCDRALSPYAAHVLGLPAQAATPPELLARALGSLAYARSGQENVRTPFAEEARKAGWPVAWCRGGKVDDITCVAAWVAYGQTGLGGPAPAGAAA